MDFFHSKKFEQMLSKVAHDDVASFKNNNSWLAYHPSKARVFSETKDVWQVLKATYNGDFRNLVFGNFSRDYDILETLLRIQKRLSAIAWEIEVG